ncbi:filamentous hemagglutinin N-terminal domain-containing protein [Tolypothrix sp. FACHB-123]|uniref:filamentous hemagglutinin N-terminal domain-containing protein n=1 Tax=Tolypothrix sp. FACHB-123 TaxID=2692868 RepID=UPI00280A4E8E|nr:filamentous hemagglutinin N-terminal domain-containing protein [Tolypothrix sp. FACHB-123]
MLVFALAWFTFISVICRETLVLAEIQPDTTLGGEPSVLTPGLEVKGATADIINGGAVRGDNLFHSFREFNIGDGQRVYFANPAGVENILTRVTGNNRSEIVGTLGVLGNANLFLINPNGIVFGANARLDVGGSFVASTADSLVFANGFAFSAINPQAPPLLTVNVPLGLQFEKNPGQIINQSQATNSTGNVIGLKVQPLKTLALVGGAIFLEKGTMIADGGQIELGSVSSNAFVQLNWSFAADTIPLTLSYNNVKNFQDIQLSGRSEISANSDIVTESIGSVHIQGERVTVSEESGIFNRNRGSKKPGNVIVNASNLVELIGGSPINEDSLINVSNSGSGGGSAVIINTSRLIIRDGAYIAATATGASKGGSLTMNASESVELIGTTLDSQFASGLFAQSRRDATGDGGTITVNTKRLIVQDGAQISTATFSPGQGGNIVIKASESVKVSGMTPNGQNSTSLTARSDRVAKGNAGSLLIETGQLLIEDGARISVSSLGSGNPGDLKVNANKLFLNRGTVEAFTSSGENANIQLQVSDFILMQNQSVINSQASNNGNGGNINIDTNFVVAAADENSDIIANAFEGAGGRINITAQGIFGLNSRETLTPLSDINASSQLGINGVVEINTPDVDPSNGLVNLPTNLVDASRLITQSCRDTGGATANQQSEFIVTGRGGLPSNPSELLNSDAVWQDLQPHALRNEKLPNSQAEQQTLFQPSTAIVEAQGLVIAANGNIMLVAQAPTTMLHGSSLKSVNCPVVQN